MVRVRFAPSPTGMLHIGSARTALLNWVFARNKGGSLILRIEDTDAQRNTLEASKAIFDGLTWLGLDWDEGPMPDGTAKGSHGPYRQSERTAIYQAYADKLVANGHAYKAASGAICLRMIPGVYKVQDLVCGEVSRDMTGSPDITLLRPDGSAVFHLTNVVDDIEMGITHVIRGADHLSNTPIHLLLYKALDVSPPTFAHIPLILNLDGSKMAKSSEGAAVSEYKTKGYLPEAVCTYLSSLGWSLPDYDQDFLENMGICPYEDNWVRMLMVKTFRLEDITRSNAKFDPAKIRWYTTDAISRSTLEDYITYAGTLLDNPDPKILKILREKSVWGEELKDWYKSVRYRPTIPPGTFSSQDIENLALSRWNLTRLKYFTHTSLETCIPCMAASTEQKTKAFIHPLRLAMTGKKVGPSLYGILEVLGQDEVIARLAAVLGSKGLEI